MKDILLIAEDPEIIRNFTEALSPEYEVLNITSPQEGFDTLKSDYASIAAVLVELELTRRNGFVISDRIQEYSSFSAIPMIAITGALPAEEDMDCFEHGYFDMIASSAPHTLINQRIGNAIRAKDSLSLTEVERMFKELPACIFLKDNEGKYVFSTQYWNHLDTQGDPNWTIRGKTDLDIRKDKDNARKAMEADRRILETGEGTEYVIEENQDGIRDYLQLIKRPIYDEEGKVNGIIALVNNITDYQLLKMELEKRLKTDSSMVTAMGADYRSIYYADLDKDECVCVRASANKDGHMWKGKEFPFYFGFVDYAMRYVVESDRDGFIEFVNPDNIRAGLANEPMISHRYLSTRSGEKKHEMLRIAGVRRIEERDDNIVHAIGAGFSDVDRETREAMEQNRTLTEALARAEEASAAKTAFLSTMSHEIRTPMNAIIGLDKIALRDPNISDVTRDELEKIGSSARHLLSLINDILDMSRIESGRMVLKQEEFSFREFVDQISIIINGQCEDKGLTFECNKIGDDAGDKDSNKTEGNAGNNAGALDEYFIGDDLRLKQVLINILGNAVKFTDAPGTVTFNIEQLGAADDEKSSAGTSGSGNADLQNTDGTGSAGSLQQDGTQDAATDNASKRLLRFTIKDTGIGMDKSFIPKLFDAFAQEDATSTNRYGGSGLGMAITKNMVDLMGGRIEVDSEKGKGTTFTVYIPLKRAGHAEARAEVGAEAAAGHEISLEGLNVLIVEDMELNAEILADLLELEDMTTEWAENGRQAVEMFKQNEAGHFDAILMDMRMPVMDGPAATRAIRALAKSDADRPDAGRSDAPEVGRPDVGRPDAATIPIIALTANAFEEDVKTCLEAGMNAHMSKPVDIEELKELLGRML